MRSIYFLLFLLFFLFETKGQNVPKFSPKVNRVLFLLDVSGSMKTDWNNETRFETAKKLLVRLIDSVEQKNPHVEFAVRAFGFQFSREQKNCTDSKLLVPFAQNNTTKIKAALDKISPKGMTPITYSIAECVSDFPTDEKALNSIILISDGEENCNGNPCEAAKLLSAKRIALKPFIVGINLPIQIAEKFNCLGTVFTPNDEQSFSNTIGVIIKQTLNTTTTQVNLLDQNGNATITNIPFSLLDHSSGKILYNFVHKQDAKGNADTLFLSPVGTYDIVVYSTPPVRKNDIELTVGKHNIIAVDVPLGNINVSGNTPSDMSLVLHSNGKILAQQNTGETKQYLTGVYETEATTLPNTILPKTYLAASATKNIDIPAFATLSLSSLEAFSVSVIAEKEKQLTTQFVLSDVKQLQLQPSNYLVIYKPTKSLKTESTKSLKIALEPGRYQSVLLK
ncbi:MAG: hypothetical protein BGO32_00160 [Bacteroidetes bacterium 37-13]|nr:MAG: hypothetical protein BGO32_00160 [Bacteroidetes bacterium 37-13]